MHVENELVKFMTVDEQGYEKVIEEYGGDLHTRGSLGATGD